jgi:predicted nucleic acid binding AN1-type Zn finger protein
MRCAENTCVVKISLLDKTINTCICGKIFCPLHRLPEAHQCTARKEAKELQLTKLKGTMPKIEATKILRI